MDKMRWQQLHSDQQFCDRYTKQKQISTEQKELNAFKKTFQKIPFLLGPKCFPGPLHLPGSSSPSFLISFFLSCAWFHLLCNSCLYCCPPTRNVSRRLVLLEQGLGLQRHREADLWAGLPQPLGSKLV